MGISVISLQGFFALWGVLRHVNLVIFFTFHRAFLFSRTMKNHILRHFLVFTYSLQNIFLAMVEQWFDFLEDKKWFI